MTVNKYERKLCNKLINNLFGCCKNFVIICLIHYENSFIMNYLLIYIKIRK